MPDPSAGTITRSPRWPWVVLGLGLVWTVLIRVPLILNAEDHLDSDLAVDGLTLIDALQGQWRWHYPGTPHMGILPLFFSYLQALIWGTTAVTLVSGGTLIWVLIVIGTFWLAWRTYGSSVAGWAILPLVFSSTGTIWLSGRITGGHLLTLGWHTLAFVGFHACISKGSSLRAAALGLWCGLGLYLDMMFLFTLLGLIPAAVLAWVLSGRPPLNLRAVAAFFIAALVGFLPHEIGRHFDPYDAYPSQFSATFEGPAVREHGRLLALHCLPRLIAGTELNEFDRRSHLDDSILVGLLRAWFEGRTSRLPSIHEWLAQLFLVVFFIGVARLAFQAIRSGDRCGKAVSFGTILSASMITAAFLVNRNIFNSDNYRYLIFLLTPWSLGFGLLASGLTRRGLSGRVIAGILVVVLIGGMTAGTLLWYRDELGYLDPSWRCARVTQLAWNEIPVSSRRQHNISRRVAYVVSPDVTHVFGDYWDVYRMAFVSGKKVVGIPYPMFPNRFPGWSRGLGPEKGKLLAIGVRREWGTLARRNRSPNALSPLNILEPPSTNTWRALPHSLAKRRSRSRRARPYSCGPSIVGSIGALAVSSEANATKDAAPGLFTPRPWGWHDAVAILVWTAAIVAYFWDAVTLRGALFYFDITEINYPYRHFFAEELRAGRFSRWCPGLYCGLPLYSESQAGYLHPLKYLLYPWMETWKALNLDTVLSIWLTGLGSYLWLRRHVGPTAALSGAAIFGLSGFTWAHFVHTSMINALASVPFVILGLEWSWSSGKWRGVVLGAAALAFQTFAGHLQDVILTVGLVVIYGLFRAVTETGRAQRLRAVAMAAGLAGLGILLSAVQWVPSKELLDRSPRAQGLTWADLTFGSWHPELLPTSVIREAYGTRARDTDWMDGYYPYHEMNTYVGLIAIALAVTGAGGKAARDRWVTFWVLLVGLSLLLMLGRFTFLFDYAHKIPILGSSREPVRFHLWAALGVAALAAVGVERLSQGANVSLRPGLILAGLLVVFSIPVLCYAYAPLWAQLNGPNPPRNVLQFRWLGRELLIAVARTAILTALGWFVAWTAIRTDKLTRRARWIALLPLLIIADLLGSHWYDVPTVDPRYWSEAPESVASLKADPGLIRVIAAADKSAAEPGYASEPIDFLAVRDQLDWSLPLAWKIDGSRGETPMIPQRNLDYTEHAKPGRGRYDIESVTHILTGRVARGRVIPVPSRPVGKAFIHRNLGALPRARLAGKPVYARNAAEAIAAIDRLTQTGLLRGNLIVEDPSRPLPPDALVSGSAQIVQEIPERLVVETEAQTASYLVVSDSFDPGWSATVDRQPATIYPAYCAFRAVYLPPGKHSVVFEYRPAGFQLGLIISVAGIVLGFLLCFLPRSSAALAPDHFVLNGPPHPRAWYFGAIAAIVLLSIPGVGPAGHLTIQRRWTNSFHGFTWGAGIKAMRQQHQRPPAAEPPAVQPPN